MTKYEDKQNMFMIMMCSRLGKSDKYIAEKIGWSEGKMKWYRAKLNRLIKQGRV